MCTPTPTPHPNPRPPSMESPPFLNIRSLSQCPLAAESKKNLLCHMPWIAQPVKKSPTPHGLLRDPPIWWLRVMLFDGLCVLPSIPWGVCYCSSKECVCPMSDSKRLQPVKILPRCNPSKTRTVLDFFLKDLPHCHLRTPLQIPSRMLDITKK